MTSNKHIAIIPRNGIPAIPTVTRSEHRISQAMTLLRAADAAENAAEWLRQRAKGRLSA